MTHFLKSWPGEFEAVQTGIKSHEVRTCVDREFVKGDDVVLREWNPAVFEENKSNIGEEAAEKRAYTGRQILRRITYVTKAASWGLPNNICVFSIQPYENR